MVKRMTMERAEVMAAAFARLRQKVVWRYTGDKPTSLGNNTKLVAWLPQNDLLGHPKTRAFITHAGSNGICEALQHGVSMVCMPFFGDQPANAARVVARGLGVKLDFSTVTVDEFHRAIVHVLTNISYRETAARLSRLHRDQPQSPMERAVWWVENVIKHGGLPHLRARAVELPWYQYYLLDVAVFLLAGWTDVIPESAEQKVIDLVNDGLYGADPQENYRGKKAKAGPAVSTASQNDTTAIHNADIINNHQQQPADTEADDSLSEDTDCNNPGLTDNVMYARDNHAAMGDNQNTKDGNFNDTGDNDPANHN
ncbi:UGT2A3 [Branchiostoma lanceolatum]|uniref:UGT2A3 protein n=1 Tax=Branchiostoma lanceolatum TaxID=7740 RepID=A0A8K0A3N7_BRALA|nr:UGT2A3 [Branchiostoma lanceolatum]